VYQIQYSPIFVIVLRIRESYFKIMNELNDDSCESNDLKGKSYNLRRRSIRLVY